MATLLARITLFLVGALAGAIGVAGIFVARHHWLEWMSVIGYLGFGGALMWTAFSRDGAKVRATIAENRRVRWGAGLTFPPLLILLGSKTLHVQLHDVAFWPLAIAVAAGAFVLFNDLG